MLQKLKQLLQPPLPPEEILDDSRQVLEECNRYFNEMNELADLVRDRHFDDGDPKDRELGERVLRLLRLRPEMARAKAQAALNFLLLEDGVDRSPVRTVYANGRTLRVFNGGADRFGQRVAELTDAVLRGEPDDPEIRRIARQAAELCRLRPAKQADLSLRSPKIDHPVG